LPEKNPGILAGKYHSPSRVIRVMPNIAEEFFKAPPGAFLFCLNKNADCKTTSGKRFVKDGQIVQHEN
jgi:hypothetical protein